MNFKICLYITTDIQTPHHQNHPSHAIHKFYPNDGITIINNGLNFSYFIRTFGNRKMIDNKFERISINKVLLENSLYYTFKPTNLYDLWMECADVNVWEEQIERERRLK